MISPYTTFDNSSRLAVEFPDYAELVSPQPIELAETQSLLGADEALLTYLVAADHTFLLVVRRDGADLQRLDIGLKALQEAGRELCGGLDPTGISRLADIPPFHTTRAFALYEKLFAPAEARLEGVRHLFVVPDADLQSLPLGVLVTEKPSGPFTDFSGYRQVPWLARKYAISVLPSVGSLRALRRFAKAARARSPFIGFGDPALEGRSGRGRGVELAALFSRGPVADVDAVRRLPPLPETADELRAIARILEAGEDAIHLRERATEARVISLVLAQYRTLAFATHGLVAGDLTGVAEPALVLTPPAKGSETDDGLLTASEVAQLKLDADLVILSACNTAAADGTPGAAVRLTTTMMAATAEGMGRAEALRQARLEMIAGGGMRWSHFVGQFGSAVKVYSVV